MRGHAHHRVETAALKLRRRATILRGAALVGMAVTRSIPVRCRERLCPLWNECEMDFLRNLSIRGKLFAGFGSVLALTVILGVVMLSQISSVNSGGVQIATNDMPSVVAINQIGTDVAVARIDQAQAMLDTDPARVAADFAAYANDATAADKLLATYGMMVTPGTQDGPLWRTARSEWDAYEQVTSGAKALAQNESVAGQAKQNALIAGTGSRFTQLRATIVRWTQVNDAVAASQAAGNASTYSFARLLGIVLLVVTVVIGAVIAFALSGSIKRRVDSVLATLASLRDHCMNDIKEGMEAFSRGDLTRRYAPVTPLIDHPGADEIGQVAGAVNSVRDRIVASIEAYNATAGRLTETIGQVAVTAGTVGSSSHQMVSTSEEAERATGEIAHAVSDVAAGAERQVRMIEDARLAAEEVARAVQESADSALETAAVAADARQIAQDGVAAAQQANAAMMSVRESSEAVSVAIGELASKSEQIGAIVQTITGIAEQTNLLALNAAIEAARAGEQGRGFAVVAEEVRKLAEESQHAAQEISTLIAGIQGETGKAVGVVEDGARRTEEGASVVDKTREAFERIGDAVDDMTARVEQIAAVSAQVAAGATRMQEHIGEAAAVAEQSSASTEEVSASTQETSASAQQIAASAAELSGNAEALNKLVAEFTLQG
jgi:methyl-accepting chemotaxis protein